MSAREQEAAPTGQTPKTNWVPLVALATAQFVMVLDQSVMNVSISQLVDDFDTTVTTIQAVITLYCLVMAMFMLTGGKIGDIIGRRRTFVIGLVIYAVRLRADGALADGGRADPRLVGPGGHRRRAGAAGHGGADRRQLRGPVAEGGVRRDRRGRRCRDRGRVRSWAAGRRRSYSWRVVFVGEVLLVALILVMTPRVADAVRTGPHRGSTSSARCCRPPASGWSCSASCSRARGAGSSPRRTRRSSRSASR